MTRSVDPRSMMSESPEIGPEYWVDRYGDCMYRYALLRLRSPELAADVVQETFLEALRVKDSFTGRSSERTWLIGILKHKIVDHFRKAGRSRVSSTDTSSPPFTSEPEFDRRGHWKTGPASWRGEPGRALETREFWDVFGRCLSGLPGSLADAFFSRELDGQSAEEVQQSLGITSANLWTRLHRARSLLRRCLEEHWFDRSSVSARR